MARHITRSFAGALRRFELLAPGQPGFRFEDARHGNLAELVRRAADGTLGEDAVRHVIIHGLASGHAGKMIASTSLVDEALRGRPFSELLPLAVDIIAAAYSGTAEAGA